MIPGQLRQFMKDLKRATDTGAAKWNATPMGGFTLEKNAISLAIWIFDDPDTDLQSFGFSVSDNSSETRFFVHQYEGDDFLEMQNMHSSISVSANNFAAKLKGLFQ